MPDLEKVIEGLEFTLVESGWNADEAFDEQLMIEAVTGAIDLLKAQEPVKPIRKVIGFGWRYFCGKCGNSIATQQRFCEKCGQAVMWGVQREQETKREE